MQAGRKIHEQIDQEIHLHERMLLILTADSMQSCWVKTEIAKARQLEVQENRQVLFPMRLVSFEAVRDWECFDADTGKDSAREIREYYIPDFSNWKNYDAYQKEFARLLRDLKAELTNTRIPQIEAIIIASWPHSHRNFVLKRTCSGLRTGTAGLQTRACVGQRSLQTGQRFRANSLQTGVREPSLRIGVPGTSENECVGACVVLLYEKQQP